MKVLLMNANDLNVGDRLSGKGIRHALDQRIEDIQWKQLSLEFANEQSFADGMKWADATIIGGGGLFCPSGAKYWRKILRCGPEWTKIVLWGVGINIHTWEKPEAWPRDVMQRVLGSSEFVGMRGPLSAGTVQPFMMPHQLFITPCPSILYPGVVAPREKKISLLILRHPYFKKDPKFEIHKPMVFDWAHSWDESKHLRLVQSAEVVVSSTYHGGLWAAANGAKIILVAISNKMHDQGRLLGAPVIEMDRFETEDLELMVEEYSMTADWAMLGEQMLEKAENFADTVAENLVRWHKGWTT